MGIKSPAKAARRAFPADEMDQTAAVMTALPDTPRPIDAGDLAGRFRQGRRVEPKVRAILAALNRMGVVSTPDRGHTFVLQRGA